MVMNPVPHLVASTGDLIEPKKEKKEKKIFNPEERQKKLLEKLGLVQMVFDFYSAPVM